MIPVDSQHIILIKKKKKILFPLSFTRVLRPPSSLLPMSCNPTQRAISSSIHSFAFSLLGLRPIPLSTDKIHHGKSPKFVQISNSFQIFNRSITNKSKILLFYMFSWWFQSMNLSNGLNTSLCEGSHIYRREKP